MMIDLLRFAFFSLILLDSAFVCGKDPTIEFKIFDGLGQPSTYLYENGVIQVTCVAPTTNPKGEVALKVDLVDDTAVELSRSNATLSANVSLGLYNYRKIFCYTGTDRSAKLVISYRMCDPMLLTPPVTNCRDDEVCMHTATNTYTCEITRSLECALNRNVFEKYLLSEKFVCIGRAMPKKDNLQKGMCIAVQSRNEEFSGIANDEYSCGKYDNLKFGKDIAVQGSIWFTSINKDKLEIQFIGIGSSFEEAVCLGKSSKDDLTTFAKGYQSNITSTRYEKHLILPLDISSIKSESLPAKFKLTCHLIAMDGDAKSTSIYLFIFDEKKFYPAIKTTLIDANTGLYSLNCEAKMVDGILFSVLWDREPDTYFAKTSDDKIIANKFDDSAQNHTCYVAAFAYNYPYKGKLLKLDLPSGSVNNSIEIEKGGAPGKCVYDTEHKTPGFCDGNAGTGTVKLDKDMMHHAGGKSAKESSVDSSYDSHLEKWEQV